MASVDAGDEAVSAVYPRPSPDIIFRQNLSCVDPAKLGYQVYPGFELEVAHPEE